MKHLAILLFSLAFSAQASSAQSSFAPSLSAQSSSAQSSSAPSLAGVIDIHAHADPDDTSKRPRSIDVIALAKLAKDRGMRGFVLKNHYESTASLAYVVREAVPGIEVFGMIVLNRQVGGINAAAVDYMIKAKGGYGRIVSMPTEDAENQVKYEKSNRPFVSIARNGQLLPEVREVLRMIAQHNLALATGHSSAAENLLLVREAKSLGVQKIIITHPLGRAVAMTIPQMQEAARQGAFLEIVTYERTTSNKPPITTKEHVDALRGVGIEHFILSTDTGQGGNPLHPDTLVTLFTALREQGFSQAEIDRMSKQNPATLLGLQ